MLPGGTGVGTGPNIHFLSVARLNDDGSSTVCASHRVSGDLVEHKEIFGKVARKYSLKKKDNKLQFPAATIIDAHLGRMHCSLPGAGNFVYTCTAGLNTDYPARVATELLQQMSNDCARYDSELTSTGVDGCDKRLHAVFTELIKSYEDPAKMDSARRVLLQIDDTKRTMEKAVDKIMSNTTNLEVIDDKAVDLSHRAKVFEKQSVELKNHYWWKNMKLWCILCMVISAIAVALLWPVFEQMAREGSKSGASSSGSGSGSSDAAEGGPNSTLLSLSTGSK
jgi:hypothetical protein